jgi:hypothetical protein
MLNAVNAMHCIAMRQVKIHEMSPAEKKVALAEVRVMNQFRSKFVVRCEGESFIEDDYLNIILEYCDAGDVKQYLAKQKKPLKEKTVQRIIVQLILGLHHIHSKRIIHRDIKAANLFLCSHMRRVKIGDLGVARTLGATKSMAQTMVGTPCVFCFSFSFFLVLFVPRGLRGGLRGFCGCCRGSLATPRHARCSAKRQREGGVIKRAPVCVRACACLPTFLPACLRTNERALCSVRAHPPPRPTRFYRRLAKSSWVALRSTS